MPAKNKPVQLELFGAEQQANTIEGTVPLAAKSGERDERSEKSSTDTRPEPPSDVSSPPQTTAEESEIEMQIDMLYEAAEQGSAEAEYELGCSFEDGLGVEQDITEAIRWYVKAAKQGHAASREALFNLFMFLLERDDPRDEVEAFYCLRKAAELGLVEAQIALGSRYADGHGLPQDDDEATHWYRMAAEQGSAEAQYELGCAYENGWGVEQDTTEALRWYAMAANQGHSSSLEERRSAELSRRALDRLKESGK